MSVSLLTRQHDDHSVDEFYCRLDTPVGHEHRIREAGFQVDELERLDQEAPDTTGINEGHARDRLLIVDILRLPKLLRSGEARLRDYRTDFIGIIACIAFVLLFLFGVDSLTQWLLR